MSIKSRIKIEKTETLSDDWCVLEKTTFQYQRRDGLWRRQVRETYHRDDAATILLYNLERRTIVLTRQFRYPAFAGGYDDLVIEAPAGLLDAASPEVRIKAEVEEETGFRIGAVRRICEAFTSPGALTERMHFFAAPYSAEDRVSDGGGLEAEGEDIECLEPTIDDALHMIEAGEIRDAKTIILLQYAALHIFR